MNTADYFRKSTKKKHYWVGKVIRIELCKQMRFIHANQWLKTEGVLEKRNLNFMRHGNRGQKTRFSYSKEEQFIGSRCLFSSRSRNETQINGKYQDF